MIHKIIHPHVQHVNQSHSHQQIPPQQHPHLHHIQPQHMNTNTGGPPMLGIGQTQSHINVPPLPQAQQPNTLQATSQMPTQQQAQHNPNYHHNQRDLRDRTIQQQHFHHPHQQRLNNGVPPPHSIHSNRGSYQSHNLQNTSHHPHHSHNNSNRSYSNVVTAVNANAMVSLPSHQQMQQSKVQSKPHHQSGALTGRNTQIIKNYRNNSENVHETKNQLPNGNAEKATNQNRLVTESIDNSNADDNVRQGLLSNESREIVASDGNAIVDKSETAECQAIKVKTPMCLVNELARHNHFQHQYRLIEEKGPAHDKSFTVTLRLGDENYTAEGKSIKKAQHSAAAEAIKLTKYSHPPEKAQRNHTANNTKYNATRRPNNSMTPMVELNTILMKLGEKSCYAVQYPTSTNDNTKNKSDARYNNNNYRNRNHAHGNISHQASSENPFIVTFTVLGKEFSGMGLTLQAAKQEAAANAINGIKSTTVNIEKDKQEIPTETEVVDSTLDLSKSAISMVYEIALKRNLQISFNVESETGPAHMKHFVTKCTVGDLMTIGEGGGKKMSKNAAAEKMLEELKKLSPLQPSPVTRSPATRSTGRLHKRNIPNNSAAKKKARNLIRDVAQTDNTTPVDDELTNPISRLLRIQQARKLKDPVYVVIEERGQQRRKEFVIEVTVNGEKAQGIGPNKKIAKRCAAENIMINLGYSKPSDTPNASKGAVAVNDKSKNVTFKELATPVTNNGGTFGRQIAPGLLLMNNNVTEKAELGSNQVLAGVKNADGRSESSQRTTDNTQKHESPSKSRMIERNENRIPAPRNENTDDGKPEKEMKTAVSTTPSCGGIRPVDQLKYLAVLLKFEIQFTDFPKGKHNEYLTLLSLDTDPPQMFHGTGNSSEASQDQASTAALKALSELGLDNVSKKQ